MSASHTRTTPPAAEGTRAAGGPVVLQEQVVSSGFARKLLALTRLVIGWTFIWPFIDKLFGLGYATDAESAVVNGGAPAQGYMLNATSGPFDGMFVWIAETFGSVADFVFMVGLFGIGIAMLTGAGLKIAAWGGALLMAFMYLAALPIGQAGEGFTNPITDSHWVEALVLLVCAYTLAGDTWGLGRWWAKVIGTKTWLR